MLIIFQCPTKDAGQPTLLDIIENHLRIPATQVWFQLCRFMQTHQDCCKGIAVNVLAWKKQAFKACLECLQTLKIPIDEIALVISARMYNLHVCVLMEEKFGTTNDEHNIGLCSLLIGLTGPLEFILLRHYTTQSGTANRSPPVDDAVNHHHTKKKDCSTLTEKLSGLPDPAKILEVIHSHVEHMPRSSTPTYLHPHKNDLKDLKENLFFYQHGIKKSYKRVQNFNCVCVKANMELKRNLTDISPQTIQAFSSLVVIVKSSTNLLMDVQSMKTVTKGTTLNASIVIRNFSFLEHSVTIGRNTQVETYTHVPTFI